MLNKKPHETAEIIEAIEAIEKHLSIDEYTLDELRVLQDNLRNHPCDVTALNKLHLAQLVDWYIACKIKGVTSA
jgi:hypothetical protein